MLSVMIAAWTKNARTQKLKAVCRLGAYTAVIVGAAGVFAAHNAHAALAEGALQLGRDMFPLKEYLQEPTALTLNGENMVLATGTTSKSTKEVLDQYESYCRNSSDSLGADWSTLSEKPAGQLNVASRLGGSFDMGVYRMERKHEGAVMCFMKGDGSQRNLRESLEAFEKTRDLGTLGKMRYAYVKGVEQGRSMVFTAWTDDHFRLDSFMPEGTNDAAGSDPAGLPRPPQSQRLLSAELKNSPFGAHVYRSAASPDEVRNYYDDTMKKDGYLALGWGDEKVLPGKNRMYLKNGLHVALGTATDETGTIVSIGEIGATVQEKSAETAFETAQKR